MTNQCSSCEKLRGVLDWMLQYVPGDHRATVLRRLEDCQIEGTRYPAHDMAQALREIGAMIPSATGGTFENDPPGAIVGALKHSLEPKPSHIKTWRERCDELHDDMVIVTSSMVQQRMQEEIDDLRAALNRPEGTK